MACQLNKIFLASPNHFSRENFFRRYLTFDPFYLPYKINTENLIIHIFDEEIWRWNMIVVRICINFEDSMLRFDDQLAFVLKYYTPSLSLEMVHETITNDNGTNVSLKFWTLNPIAQTKSQDMKTWKFSFGRSGQGLRTIKEIWKIGPTTDRNFLVRFDT